MREDAQTSDRGAPANASGAASGPKTGQRPTKAQLAYLRRGLDQPGGKLPLFDAYGQRIAERTVQSCLEQGWAAPWFNNPLKPDWLVCKLTDAGRAAAEQG